MSIVDDRGRVFGRFNLVDVALVLFVVVLLPAAYGAYRLFRDPAAHLSAVTPKALQQGSALQVEVRGEHLRPYMRVSFGDQQGQAFWFVSATTAVVPLPPLPPGTYDVVLYDYMQEVSRLPKAFTVQPQPSPPTAELDVSGTFSTLTPEGVKAIGKGLKFFQGGAAFAEVIWIGEPAPEVLQISTGDKGAISVPVDRLQLPARIRTTCLVQTAPDGTLRCSIGGVALAPGLLGGPALGLACVAGLAGGDPLGLPDGEFRIVGGILGPRLLQQCLLGLGGRAQAVGEIDLSAVTHGMALLCCFGG